MATKQYDRAAEDIGNIVGLEHVNVLVENQVHATLFYISGIGLTRDPYMMTSIDNMWVNVGPRSQFHLPTGKPQVLRGRIGLTVPDRAALLRRLGNVKKHLEGTKYDFAEREGYVEATCPWGNVFRLHEPAQGALNKLTMAYVEFDVATGSAKGIADFYSRIFDAPSRVDTKGKAPRARVSVGLGQELIFRETDANLATYDGHHIQVYVANFSGPHGKLLDRGLITEESNQYQYRFDTIVDLDGNKKLFQIEHEVRSMSNPMYARPLVNRNPLQNNRNYIPGRDGFVPDHMDAAMDNPRDAQRMRLG
jgi:hypothetical protein